MTSIDLSDAFLHILIHCLASTYVSIGKYDPIVLDPATHTRVISQPLRSLAMDKSVLETNRMENIRRRFVENGYSDSAVDDLSSPYLDDTDNSFMYKRAQYNFIQWARQHSIGL